MEEYIEEYIKNKIIERNKNQDYIFGENFHVKLLSSNENSFSYKYFLFDHYLEDVITLSDNEMKRINRNIKIDNLIRGDTQNNI